MIPIGLFSQIATILLSAAIIFTYVKPTFSQIAKTQDDVSVYQTEYEKVSGVNTKLNQLVSSIESISSDDQRRLLTYMPDSVDTVGVPRDLNFIAEEAGVALNSVAYEGTEEKLTEVEMAASGLVGVPQRHVFAMQFEGSYSQIKQMLKLIEENDYPLEVQDLIITQTEGGFLSANVKIATYNLRKPVSPALEQGVTQ